jgi:hypothetical protein
MERETMTRELADDGIDSGNNKQPDNYVLDEAFCPHIHHKL